MKRYVFLVVFIVIIITLSGCSKENNNNVKSVSTTTSAQESVDKTIIENESHNRSISILQSTSIIDSIPVEKKR